MRLSSKLNQVLLTLTILGSGASAHAGWKQTFNEDFSAPQIDTNVWTTRDYWGLQNNVVEKDAQCFDDLNNISVVDGRATIKATNGVPFNCVPDLGNLKYTSGLLNTSRSFFQQWGYFEVRARGAKGAGLASQVKLQILGGSFPTLPPEFAFMEILGKAPQNAVQRYTVQDDQSLLVDTAKSTTGQDFSAEFHTYGMDWQPGLVVYYLDGVETLRVAKDDLYVGNMFISMGLSVGSVRGGEVDETILPATMDIDYVRAYQRVEDGTDSSLPPGVKPPTPPPPPAPPKDTLAPTVKVTGPSTNARVVFGSQVTLSATATDDVGVTEVQFFVSDKQVCSVKAAPFTCKVIFDEKVVNAKSMTVTAKARDAAGNLGSNSVQVAVQPSLLMILLSFLKALLKLLLG